MRPTPSRSTRSARALAACVVSVALLGAGCDDGGDGSSPADDVAAGDVGGGSDATGGGDEGGPYVPEPPTTCLEAAARTYAGTFLPAQARVAACFQASGEECAADDAELAALRAEARDALAALCTQDEVDAWSAAGSSVTVDAWLDRLADGAVWQARMLGRRVYGGPKGVLLQANAETYAGCGEAAMNLIGPYLQGAFASALDSDCLAAGGCSADDVAGFAASLASSTVGDLIGGCGEALGLMTFTPERLVADVDEQVAALLAMVVGDSALLPVLAGPSNMELPDTLPAGEWIPVELDSDLWGTKCADGSPYRFWLRPGAEPDKVVVQLAGGGVCFEALGCRVAESTGLFTAEDDVEAPPSWGFMATDEDNPFAAWTMAWMPYCTQDVFAGGGGTETLSDADGDIVIERYGALNVRAAMQLVRDATWRLMDEQVEGGYHPERVTTVYGGTSAGGFGVYNTYSYVLDHLGWADTLAVPKAWYAQSAAIPIEALFVGFLDDWQLLDGLSPACNTPDCAVAAGAVPRIDARLGATPRQRMIVATKQLDEVQSGQTFHPSITAWASLVRERVCEQIDLPHTRFFLPANADVLEAVIAGEAVPTGHDAGAWTESNGEPLIDYVAGAIADPAGLAHNIEEGDLVSLSADPFFDGDADHVVLEPFACLP